MSLSAGLPLRVAHEWVMPLINPSQRLQAFEALTCCDPIGVAKVPARIAPVAAALGWEYDGEVLVVPNWPVLPDNPAKLVAWRTEVEQRIAGAARAAAILQAVLNRWASALGNGNGALIPRPRQLQFLDLPATRTRHFPLPPGAHLVHGLKGDYYVLRGRIEYPAAFETFWKLYPRPVEKAVAYGVWLALDPSAAEAQAICEGARRYASNPYTHAEAHRTVPYPSRWLQRRRWEDEDAPIPFRSHEDISQAVENRPNGVPVLCEEDFR